MTLLQKVFLFSCLSWAALFSACDHNHLLIRKESIGNEAKLNSTPGPCKIVNSSQESVVGKNFDALALILEQAQNCPSDVTEFKNLVQSFGFQSAPTMVANRGFHNPKQGSFSFFEMVSGESNALQLEIKSDELFFGHFTELNSSNELVLSQTPTRGALMIELIAFDTHTGFYNFYELIGNGETAAVPSTWIYRGNSADIQSDIKNLFAKRSSGVPAFGNKLRCSGCHLSGGPIMKELQAPHNDWWTAARPLKFEPNLVGEEVKNIVLNLEDASKLADSVISSQKKLLSSPQFLALKAQLSYPEQLRPLFCDQEINLESFELPNDSNAVSFQIPAKFFLTDFDLPQSMSVSKSKYLQALAALETKFPETNLPDSDHGWLTPVKATSDLLAIESQVKSGLIDDEFVSDVLAVDFQVPVLSKKRCELLKLLPQEKSSNWKEKFEENLAASNDLKAQELLQNLQDPSRDLVFHKAEQRNFINNCSENETPISSLLKVLFAKQASVFSSEISSNPRGQILEPGFRVIFSKPKVPIRANAFELNTNCQVQTN